MATASRWLLALSGVAALAFTFYVYSVSPDIVPVHYAANGAPDRWGPRQEVLHICGWLIGISTACFLAAPALFRRAPAAIINLPHKDYWLSPEHRDAAAGKLAAWASAVGIAINVLMVALQSAALGQDGAPGVPSALTSWLPLLFVAFALASCVWLVRAYRLPTHVR
ncbi:MAG TPA: DUF1648 domain-containing protein [Polyangiaceae bacterium]|nr:DUF1648 domain-containing protein [Polyangiaceae bacterium]